MAVRKIIHVDMDCFYAAVEVKHRPELKGKPLGIGGPPNSRSVLCTASYEARKFGVRAAMPSSQAVRLCPQLILVPPNFPLYVKESKAVREILNCYTSEIEPLSLDEAYLDVTNSPFCGGSATLIAKEIRQRIADELGLPASAGIAPNKFLAKIASDWKKPNGQFVVRPQDIDEFSKALKIEKIFGVGKVTAKKMHELGLFTCDDIRKAELVFLKQHFGSRAEDLVQLAYGIDDRPVQASFERKSVSVEETYNKDITTLKECLSKIPELYIEWSNRMQKSDYRERIGGYSVKIKFHDFVQTTQEVSGSKFPTVEDFTALMESAWSRGARPVRLLGVGVKLKTSEKKTEEESPQLVFKIA